MVTMPPAAPAVKPLWRLVADDADACRARGDDLGRLMADALDALAVELKMSGATTYAEHWDATHDLAEVYGY